MRKISNNKHVTIDRWNLRAPFVAIAVMLVVVVSGIHSSRSSVPGVSHDMGNMIMDAGAYPATQGELPKTGWTATADSNSVNFPVANAIDGNKSTFWMTPYNTGKDPVYPHTYTIDTHKLQPFSGLTYTPRQDDKLYGTIGQYDVSVSSNGTTWTKVTSGTWSYDHWQKTIEFAPIVGRYVRLTGYTEGGAKDVWATAAEIGLYGNPAMGPSLSRLGWTATADSQVYDVAGLFDGNYTTIWETPYSPTAVPYPHTVTVDTKKVQPFTGLSYMPRQDASLNGTIGKYSISVSSDGATWTTVASGTWADSHYIKYAQFATVQARYVRLTALSESGNRGQWASGAELYLHGVAPSSGAGGSWGTTIGFPEVPVTAVALPNNKLLTFSADSDMSWTTTATNPTRMAIYDMATGKVSQPSSIDTQHQMFCVGLAILADGRVLVNGGSGDSSTSLYDPYTNSWTIGPKMNIPRAYESSTVLSTGQVFTLGGSWKDSTLSKDGEIYTPDAGIGAWTNLSGVPAGPAQTADPGGRLRSDNHMWLFAISGGNVFQAGPSKQMNWITTSGNGSITSAGNRSDSQDAMNGNAVMYDVNKILTLGGSTAYTETTGATNVQATNRAYTLDISGGINQPVTVTRTGDMAYARAFSSSVVLPDGKVVAFGGQQHPATFTDTALVTVPEMWDPATGQFTQLSPAAVARGYHSVAVLLSDGRIFTGGSGLCGYSCTVNHSSGQIFTPPYLLNADGSLRARPTITQAPGSAVTGANIQVTTGAAVSSFALVRIGGTTHAINTDQRRIPLTASTVSGTTYGLDIPTDKGVVLPGNYFLFALDANGTPSVAKVINIR